MLKNGKLFLNWTNFESLYFICYIGNSFLNNFWKLPKIGKIFCCTVMYVRFLEVQHHFLLTIWLAFFREINKQTIMCIFIFAYVFVECPLIHLPCIIWRASFKRINKQTSWWWWENSLKWGPIMTLIFPTNFKWACKKNLCEIWLVKTFTL